MKAKGSIGPSFKEVRPVCFYLLVFLSFLFFSCASTKPDPRFLEQAQSASKRDKINSEIALMSGQMRGQQSQSDYRIGPEDLLEIDVFRAEELKTVVRVSARGDIRFPLIGRIEASGLTASELESKLAGQLHSYLEEPAVSVFIKEYRSQRITVLGAVRNPNIYAVTGRKYLLDMLSLAGGLTDDAGTLCYIQKVSGDDPSNRRGAVIVDIDELLMNGKAELNVPLSSGDVIHVPKSGVFFVDGAVINPGSFQLKGKTTITQALSMAKGFKEQAAGSGIRIYRDNGRPERDIIAVNYDSILNGEAQDVLVMEKDIIIVPESGVKNFFGGVRSILRDIFSFGVRL